MYDVIVVGGGPAGLSAALSLSHFRRSVLLFDTGEQRNRAAHAVHNYLGFEGMPPSELIQRGRKEAQQAGTLLRDVRVTAVQLAGQDFTVINEGGSIDHARRLLLATGLVDVKPDIENIDPFYGKQLVHCPACDAATFADRPMVVLSWGQKAVSFTLELRNWTKELTLITHGHPLDEADRHRLAKYGVAVNQERAQRLEGDARNLRQILLVSGDRVRCDAVFFNVGHRPRSELAQSLGCALSDEGHVKVDEKQQTSVRGVYAAGDITPDEQSVVTGAAEGFVAAANIHLSLYPEL